jgi:hypothetical protein
MIKQNHNLEFFSISKLEDLLKKPSLLLRPFHSIPHILHLCSMSSTISSATHVVVATQKINSLSLEAARHGLAVSNVLLEFLHTFSPTKSLPVLILAALEDLCSSKVKKYPEM